MPTTPTTSWPSPITRVLLATTMLHRPTMTSVAEATGLSRGYVYVLLQQLREEGLVDWEPHHVGTLRPLVQVVW